jgi:CheY-like chemotaxis protein
MKSHQLLIVEDEFILAMDMEERLAEMGYSVVGTAHTGAAAIAAAEQHQPDLILMDIHLAGGMDGIAAAREIRRNHDIPVLFLTAYADEETRQRAQAVQSYAFLSKPTEDWDLREAIDAALAGAVSDAL